MVELGQVYVGPDSCVKELSFHMAELLGSSCMCMRTLASVMNAIALAFGIANLKLNLCFGGCLKDPLQVFSGIIRVNVKFIRLLFWCYHYQLCFDSGVYATNSSDP